MAPEQTVLEWADKRGKNKKEYSRQLTSKTPKASTVWYLKTSVFLSKKNEKEDLFQIITTSSSNNHHPLQKLGSFYVRDIKDKRLSL